MLKLALISLVTFSAYADVADLTANFVGSFSQPTQTFVIGYQEAESCLADSGDWDADMELCFFDTENTAKISVTSEGLSLEVSTVGSNAHECHFEGPLSQTSANTLVSSVEAMVWNGDDYVPGTCEVTVTFEDANTVNVSNNGSCQEFCGARAWLDLGPATRQ